MQLDFTCGALPADRPRYLMGVGAPEDIVEAVFRGWISLTACCPPHCPQWAAADALPGA